MAEVCHSHCTRGENRPGGGLNSQAAVATSGRQLPIDFSQYCPAGQLLGAAQTPTLEEEREKTRLENVMRSRNNPPVTEIWSAKALNDVLSELQKQAGKGVLTTSRGPKELLGPETLNLVNVTSASRGGNVGPVSFILLAASPLALWISELSALRPKPLLAGSLRLIVTTAIASTAVAIAVWQNHD